jgi:hypothetical protein
MISILQSLQGQPKIIKNYRNTKSTNQNKKTQMKVCLVFKKCKRAKNSYDGMTEPKVLKKLLKHLINQSERIFPKNKNIFSTSKV